MRLIAGVFTVSQTITPPRTSMRELARRPLARTDDLDLGLAERSIGPRRGDQRAPLQAGRDHDRLDGDACRQAAGLNGDRVVVSREAEDQDVEPLATTSVKNVRIGADFVRRLDDQAKIGQRASSKTKRYTYCGPP